MKRKLTPREWILLGLLFCVAAASAYAAFFYMPVTTARDSAIAETEVCRTELEVVRVQVEDKERMERELKKIFEETESPLSLAPYDNLKQVMVELNAVLAGAADYSLSFGTVNTEEPIVRRSISLTFTAGSYQRAKDILRQLHDSAYRCMVNEVNVAIGQGGSSGNLVTVNAGLVYFEYQ